VYIENAEGGWNQNGVLGWETKVPVGITIDLGKVQPISGVSFSTVVSNDDWVQWIAAAQIFTSDDSDTWHYAGELISLSRKNGEPPTQGRAKYRFVTHDLQARGRYVRFIVFPRMECFFCDEIEVYKGGDDLLSKEMPGEVTKDPDATARRMYFESRVIYRLNADAKAVRSVVAKSKVSASEKARLNGLLINIEKKIQFVRQENTPSFRAILPINEVDAQIYSVYGSLLKSSGLPRLFAWKANSYDLSSPTAVPVKGAQNGRLSITMLKNEYRADSFQLTNASAKPVDATISVKGLPGGANPKWLSICAMPWTDTVRGIPVSAAMVPAKYANGVFKVHLAAGMTSRIWVTVDSSKIKSGKYAGKLVAKSAGSAVNVPFNLRVSTVKMGTPRLSFTEWDYTFKPGVYAITPTNIDAAVAMMKSHYVDSPWARPSDIVLPDADSFDANGKLIKPISFEGFDEWVNRWKGARNYLIFLNAPTTFAGTEMGTKEFDVRVASWAKALGDHARSMGVSPESMGIMIKDEPSAADLKVIVAWAKPIRESIHGIKIFQDCNNPNAYNSPVEMQAHELSDISCPEINHYYGGGPGMEKMFAKLVGKNHKLWFYQCSGPIHLLDPYQYNRLEAWHCFAHGATGMGLWAFADTGVFKDSWNEYALGGSIYAPVFFKGDEIVSGIHYEAVREGIEDFEYLSMLKDASQRTKNPVLKSKADKLLKEAVDSVIGDKYIYNSKKWTWNNDRTKADAYRVKILALIEEMNSPEKSK
jgi:hypothetical protein